MWRCSFIQIRIYAVFCNHRRFAFIGANIPNRPVTVHGSRFTIYGSQFTALCSWVLVLTVLYSRFSVLCSWILVLTIHGSPFTVYGLRFRGLCAPHVPSFIRASGASGDGSRIFVSFVVNYFMVSLCRARMGPARQSPANPVRSERKQR